MWQRRSHTHIWRLVGPLESPGVGHRGVLCHDVWVGLSWFWSFPRLHHSGALPVYILKSTSTSVTAFIQQHRGKHSTGVSLTIMKYSSQSELHEVSNSNVMRPNSAPDWLDMEVGSLMARYRVELMNAKKGDESDWRLRDTTWLTWSREHGCSEWGSHCLSLLLHFGYDHLPPPSLKEQNSPCFCHFKYRDAYKSDQEIHSLCFGINTTKSTKWYNKYKTKPAATQLSGETENIQTFVQKLLSAHIIRDQNDTFTPCKRQKDLETTKRVNKRALEVFHGVKLLPKRFSGGRKRFTNNFTPFSCISQFVTIKKKKTACTHLNVWRKICAVAIVHTHIICTCFAKIKFVCEPLK